jgi:hypothetical protein
MSRQRPSVASFTADGPALAAILDVLCDLYDLFDERLPRPPADARDSEAVVRLTEPATAPQPADDTAPVEPDTAVTAAVDTPARAAVAKPPPRVGRGSGLEAWQWFADAAGVHYPAGASRSDVIAACVAAKVIPAE